MASCRPHSILPHVAEADPEELVAVLRRFPSQLASEVGEYLSWRGVEVDLDTRRLVRKTLELSSELSTVAGLARALYMSRRALGRRFLSRGLPVPSHWLHFGRILRGSLKLQNPSATLFSVGRALGYPDGFAFSNQMKRLTGLRPSIMKEAFGWEWIVESWLQKEAAGGGLSPESARRLFPPERRGSPGRATAAGSKAGSGMRVAEDSGPSE
jgi:AraC-like DNA-binding protein